MSKGDPQNLPDFHLWASVAKTVAPLRRRGRLMRAVSGPLPMPAVPKAPPGEKTTSPSEKKAGAGKNSSKKLGKKPDKILGWEGLPPYRAPVQKLAVADKGLDPAIHKKVRRGRIEIDGTIDLHGMSAERARTALRQYIAAQAARGARTLLVITGKGVGSDSDYIAAMSARGILRALLPIWLGEAGLAHLVAGWSLAGRGHGGEGAWYVRLRRPMISP